MKKSLLAEFGCDARSFAGDREGCCVGGTWRGRAVSLIGWRPGIASVEKTYFKSIEPNIPMMITMFTIAIVSGMYTN